MKIIQLVYQNYGIAPEEIANVWQELGNGKLHFFLVHKENIENVLSQIKNTL